jgi:hypothetical protein
LIYSRIFEYNDISSRSYRGLLFPGIGEYADIPHNISDHDDTAIILVLRVLGCSCFARTTTTLPKPELMLLTESHHPRYLIGFVQAADAFIA